MATHTTDRYRFEDVVLDVPRRTVLRDGAPVELEPRTFDVLCHLVEHRDRVVTKEELLDAVWGDRFVGDSALATRIKHARAALGDDGRAQRVIRTVHRVGYQFVADTVESARPRARPAPGGPGSVATGGGLIGRDQEVAEVAARLDRNQLVMVTGPAGVGKTALARLVAVQRATDGPVPFCELGTARDADDVADVVLAALGEPRQSGADPGESLLRVLEGRRGVLVLDNCEHVLASAGELVDRIASRCPQLRILATSREPLGVNGESIVTLEPLGLDDAVEYFCARAADAGAEIDGGSGALRELCDRLDRLPLAIELAAARSRLLTPQEMIDLLDDRFRLLRGSGSGPHHSLHAAIASSWDSLAGPDAALLARLAVFVGPFTMDDARHVAMAGTDPLDVVDALERLVRHSLLAVRAGDDGRNRFHLLESVREFVVDESPVSADMRRAHLDYFVRRAEELDAACQTPALDAALAEFRECWVDLRAAVRAALEFDDPGSVERIVRAVVGYAELFAVLEVADWCGRLERHPATPTDEARHADAVAVHARMLAHQGELDRAGELARRARALHESHVTLLATVWWAYYTGELDTVLAIAPRLVELSRSERGVDRAYAEGFMAIVAAVQQDETESAAAVGPERAARGALGAFETLAAGLRLCASDPAGASMLLEAVVEESLRRDYRLLLGAAASTLTQIALPARPAREAMQVLARTLLRYRERSMWNLIAADIAMAARLLADAGDPEVAARLLGARLASGYSVGLSEVLAGVLRAELSEQLGPRYDELVAQGGAWRPPEAADVAVEHLGRAIERVAPSTGDRN